MPVEIISHKLLLFIFILHITPASAGAGFFGDPLDAVVMQ